VSLRLLIPLCVVGYFVVAFPLASWLGVGSRRGVVSSSAGSSDRGESAAAMPLCAVVGCENESVEIGTIEADAGLIARFPICVEHRDFAVREGIAGRRWELLLDHDRYTVEREP